MFNWEDPDSIATAELVTVISWKGDGDLENEEIAKKAGLVFFHRFGPSLIKKSERLCIKHQRELSDALIIAQRSIRKFIHSGTFDFEQSNLKNPDSAVKAYLNKTAFHELVNLGREEKRIENNPYTGNEGLIYKMNQLEVFKNNPEPIGRLKKYLELVDHVLSDVNDTHKMIFLTYIDAGVKEGDRPPQHLIDLLMKTTGLSRITIRGIVNNIRKRIKPIWDVYSKEK